jgi:hypothetical protein
MQITTKIKQIFKIKCRDVIQIIKKKKKKIQNLIQVQQKKQTLFLGFMKNKLGWFHAEVP